MRPQGRRPLARAIASGALVLAGCVSAPAEDASGGDIYLQLCARCHANDLSGGVGPALGPGSNSARQPDDFNFGAIADGLGRMPSFGQTLSTNQIDRVVEYLRQAQGQG